MFPLTNRQKAQIYYRQMRRLLFFICMIASFFAAAVWQQPILWMMGKVLFALYIISWVLLWMVSHFLVRAQRIISKPQPLSKNRQLLIQDLAEKSQYTYQDTTQTLESGIRIESFMLKKKDYDPTGLHVIYFSGRESSLEKRSMYGFTHERIVMHVFHNYQGVGGSTGGVYGARDLLLSGCVQVESLLKQGIKPENIICYGNSLGGAAATLCVRYFHDRGFPISLINDRSFASLGDVIAAQCLRNHWSGHQDKSWGKVKRACAFIFNRLCDWIGWGGMEIFPIYQSIAPEYKKIVAVKGDSVIPWAASLYRRVKRYASPLEEKGSPAYWERKKYNQKMKLSLEDAELEQLKTPFKKGLLLHSKPLHYFSVGLGPETQKIRATDSLLG